MYELLRAKVRDSFCYMLAIVRGRQRMLHFLHSIKKCYSFAQSDSYNTLSVCVCVCVIQYK